MGYIKYNENPCRKNTTDCTVRALSTLLDEQWEVIYLQLCIVGLEMCEMPSNKAVINEFLRRHGYQRFTVSNHYPTDYSVSDFTDDHPHGLFMLATDSHVVPVIDGFYVDSWDSGREPILFYWRKGSINDAV